MGVAYLVWIWHSSIRISTASTGQSSNSVEISSTNMESSRTTKKSNECTCVHCLTDEYCGGLWTGDSISGDAHFFEHITLVISHCLHSLDWLSNFTKGFAIQNTTVISKCNHTVEGVDEKKITIIRLPNVGRCDHSYAHWMTDFVGQNADDENNDLDEKRVVVFLKDDRSDESIHQPGLWRSLQDMLRIASGTGFACGMKPTGYEDSSVSSYHEANVLKRYKMKGSYASEKNLYDKLSTEKEQPFSSKYRNLGVWVSDLGLALPPDLTQVCYAGTFAASAKQIRKQPGTVWDAIERSLSRGNNIEEGHYAERMWATLLSNPLDDYQVAALRSYSHHQILRRRGSVFGALMRKHSD
jgi:hypothetical protein